MTPYSLQAPFKRLFLFLGHSIVYVPMRNLIQSIGDVALMPKVFEK